MCGRIDSMREKGATVRTSAARAAWPLSMTCNGAVLCAIIMVPSGGDPLALDAARIALLTVRAHVLRSSATVADYDVTGVGVHLSLARAAEALAGLKKPLK